MERTAPQITDIGQLSRNRDRAAQGFETYNFLKREASQRLSERLFLIKGGFSSVLDVGCHTGELGACLSSDGHLSSETQFTQLELSSEMAALASHHHPASVTDMDVLPVDRGQFDLVMSSMFLHWVNDLPGLLSQMRLALKPDGLLMVNLLGGRSLTELRQSLVAAETEVKGGMSPHCLPMADIADLGGLLQRAGFALPVADAELIEVHYPDMFRLMADLRGMGEQNALIGRQKGMSSRAVFFRAAEIYAEHFSTETGQVKASFELITLTAWSPSENQPKPLRPGSAEHRLSDALESDEITVNPETGLASPSSEKG